MHPITPAQLRTGLDTISAWLLPETIPAGVRVFVAAVALAALGLLWRRLTVTQAGQALTRVVRLFVLCYLALLLATITFVYTNVPLDARLLVPLLVSAILVGWRLPDSAAPGTPARRGLLAACWALVILAGVRAGAWVAAAEVEDLGYASRAWRQSAIVEAVRALPGDVLIVSNAPDAIYVLTGRRAEFVPLRANPFTRALRTDYPVALAALDASLRAQPSALVYFRWLRWRWYLAPERELVQVLSLARVADVGVEGALYAPRTR